MRNLMICATLVLAIFLGWPLAFGGKGQPHLGTARAEAKAPAIAAVRIAEPAAVSVPVKPESCYKRYQRTIRECSGRDASTCRLGAADHWDMCEATGFWPE
jgi:hypothetical protein